MDGPGDRPEEATRREWLTPRPPGRAAAIPMLPEGSR